MQITDVTQHHLQRPMEGSFEPTWIPGYPQGSHEVELFEIETDAGSTGLAASPSFTSYEENADTLDCAPSTANELLRRAEAAIVAATLDGYSSN